jgi:pimeloyl-ACP methyl ester carboxylesterase
MLHRSLVLVVVATLAAVAAFVPSSSSFARDDSQEILSLDHRIAYISTAPPIAGEQVQLYLRERVQPQTLAAIPSLGSRVVLFVHGAWLGGTGEFDAPYQDYSWMAYLAQSGLDTFSVDLTGYGYSTRPSQLDDPCNLDPDQQATLVPSLMAQPCSPNFTTQLTTIRSDWDDLDAVVNYLRTERHVDSVNIVGWSGGGMRAGGYAALHPDKVARLVFLAPTYDRDHTTTPAPRDPDAGPPALLMTRDAFFANWDRQVQCGDQFDPAIRDALWQEGLQADGVDWAPEVRRVPSG